MNGLFEKLKAAANRPRRPATRKELMLGSQAVFILFVAILVVIFRPEKSYAVGLPLFVCFVWSLVLFLHLKHWTK